MFKRRKKARNEEESMVESLPLEVESEPCEDVAKEIAEEVNVFEASGKNKQQEKMVPDSPTVRISDIKDLTEDLIIAEAEELLSDTQNNNEENGAETSADFTHTKENPSNEPDHEENEETETLADEKDEASDKSQKKSSVPQKKEKTNKFLKKKKKSSFRRKQEWKNRLSLIGNIIMWTVSVCLFLFCLSNLYQQILNKDKAVGFFNVGNAVVVSESMVPVLQKNDFIVYKSTAIEQLRPEDIVVYKKPVADGHILIVHRLIAITDGYAVTKGDNNSIQDEPFEADNIVGKVVFTVPQLGLAMESLSSSSGIIAVIMLFCLLTLSQIIYRKLAYNAWLKKLAQTQEERKAIQAFLDM